MSQANPLRWGKMLAQKANFNKSSDTVQASEANVIVGTTEAGQPFRMITGNPMTSIHAGVESPITNDVSEPKTQESPFHQGSLDIY